MRVNMVSIQANPNNGCRAQGMRRWNDGWNALDERGIGERVTGDGVTINGISDASLRDQMYGL